MGEKFIQSESGQDEYKLEAYMGINGLNEGAQRFFISIYRDGYPRHDVYTNHRIVHYLYVHS